MRFTQGVKPASWLDDSYGCCLPEVNHFNMVICNAVYHLVQFCDYYTAIGRRAIRAWSSSMV